MIRCKKCNRPLKNNKHHGFGPVCWKKEKIEKTQSKDLLKDFEVKDV